MAESLFDAPATAGVRVALPLPVDELFDYEVPAALAESARPGCRVHVAVQGRALTGIIVERVSARSLRPGARPVDDVIDAEPALAPDLLAILQEEAQAVLCPPGLALQAALPPGSAPSRVEGRELTARGRAAHEAGAARGGSGEILAALAAGPAPRTALLRLVPGAPELLRGLERDDLVARALVSRGPAARERTERVVARAPGATPEIAARELARAPKQAALWTRLPESGEVPLRSLARDLPQAAALVRALVGRGLARVRERPAPRDVFAEPREPDRPLRLTAAQAEALAPIERAVVERRAETFLLHGVTGSGKTEVYLRAIDAALRAGRQALVLVPEITLTHQIVARLRARFGDALAILHSGLSPGERVEQWQRLRRGHTPIAVGARSALFAPLESPGLIVIDEEHDGAYKNDEGFRYHARDLAARRARRAGCPVVLGSATPALETRHEACRGEIARLVLPGRIADRPLPRVDVVDLVRERERLPRGRKLVLSRALRRALAETRADGGQAILLLNRRGFSTQILCFGCGRAERCRDCDIALVYHASDQRLRCHYCDYTLPPPERCPGCGAPDTALLGIGTQRLEEEVRAALPDARVARLDRDTASRRGVTARILRELREGSLDVVVGTQIVAKGHDFPGVRLVGVVLADIGLHIPDFRAAERSFQLLTQVAGRAGRDRAPGRVLVQTYAPDHYAVRFAAEHDYEGFYAEEIEHRRAAGYPPFGRLCHALVQAEAEDAATAGAERLAAAARAAARGDCEVLGPAPAPLARLRGRHRVQLLVKGGDAAAVRRCGEALRAAGARLPAGVQAAVDLNPTNML